MHQNKPPQFYITICKIIRNVVFLINFDKVVMEDFQPPCPLNNRTPDEVIDGLLRYRDRDRIRLIDKFTISYLMLELNRNKLQQVQSFYRRKPCGLDVIEFTRLFLNSITHRQDQTIYLVMAIIELFQQVCAMHNVKLVRFDHLTNYFCQRIFQDQSEIGPIKTRLLPCYKNVQPAIKVSTIEVEAPVIYGETEQCIVKLSQNKRWRTDRYKHYGMMKYATYDKTLKAMLCLDHLADYIGVYDMDCVLIRKIEPTCTAFRKDINILAFAYSERQERVGAVLKDYSLVFWDIRGKVDSEKMFSITQYCSDYQCSIWYLERHDLWVTGDKSGNIYTWDLNDQKPLKCINLKLQTKVTDLCEIPCLNLVALSQQHKIEQQQRKHTYRHRHDRVSQEMKQKHASSPDLYKVILYNIRQGSRVSEISLSHRGIHTLHYSNTYQVLLSCGFETKIDILQVNPKFFDISIKGSLVGHESMITTFTPVQNTPVVISADDKGKIKLWDIRSCKCIQTVELGDQIQISRLVNMLEIGKLGMVGLRINILNFQKRAVQERNHSHQKVTEYPIKVQFQPNLNEIIVFTKKDVRFYDLITGTIKFINSGYFEQDEEIISAKYIPSQRQYILCNDRGEIKVFSAFNGQFIANMLPHTSQVSGIRYDCLNRLFITSSWDSTILIQKQNAHGNFVEMRRMSDNFNKKQINIMDVSVYHNVIAIACSSEGLIYLWDYELGKLLNGISFGADEEPASLAFINGYATLIVGTSNGRVHFVKFHRKQMEMNLELFASHIISKHGGVVSPIVVDTRIVNSDQGKDKLVLCQVVVGSSKGQIFELNLTHIFQNQSIIPHASNRMNYNAQVILKENFMAESSKKFFKLFKILQQNIPIYELYESQIRSFQAHNSSITDIILIEARDIKFRISCGLDCRVKFWTRGGNLVADSNINMPLPYKWDLPIKTTLRKKDRLTLALKVIRSLVIKHGSNMSRAEQDALSIDEFLTSLKPVMNPPPSPIKKSVKLLQDELSRKDLHYESIKKNNFKDIAGLSLKEMGFQKRIRIIQKSLKSQEKDMEEHERLIAEAQSKDAKVQQKSELMSLLYIKSQNSNHNSPPLTINLKQFFSKVDPNEQKSSLRSKQNSRIIEKLSFDKGVRERKKPKPHTPFQRYYLQSRYEQSDLRITSTNQLRTRKQKKKVFEKILSNMNKELDVSKKSWTSISNHSLAKSLRSSHRTSLKSPNFFSTQPSFLNTPIKVSPKRKHL